MTENGSKTAEMCQLHNFTLLIRSSHNKWHLGQHGLHQNNQKLREEIPTDFK